MTRRYAACFLIFGLFLTGCQDTGASDPDGVLADSASPPVASASPTPTPTPTPTLSKVKPPKVTVPSKHPRAPKPAPPRKPVVRHPVRRPPVHHAPSSRPAAAVHPGAFCSPAGAFGHTTAGTLMQCKGPGQPRWRRA